MLTGKQRGMGLREIFGKKIAYILIAVFVLTAAALLLLANKGDAKTKKVVKAVYVKGFAVSNAQHEENKKLLAKIQKENPDAYLCADEFGPCIKNIKIALN